jgi:hypothetical protein
VRVAKSTSLDLADFADLPLRAPETTAQSVARVFVGAGAPFTLGLDVRRHAFEEVAKAVVYRALAAAVVDRSGWTRVAVSYKVYNRSEQFMRVVLPSDTRLLSVLVAGEGVRPLAEGGDLLVPLRKLALGSTAFDVDVVYAYQDESVGRGGSQVRLPSVKGLDVRRTALVLRVPKGFSYDFETKMEESSEALVLAEEATDRYQELKEISDVAQRGNRLQAGRALANAQQLDQEARRLLEMVKEKSPDEGRLQQQVESQERALDTLNKANRAQQAEPQTGYADDATYGKRGAGAWEANEAFMERARDEERKQVDEFKAKKAQAAQGQAAEDQTLEGTIYKGGQFRGPSGGVPPGVRDPSDPEPPPPPPVLDQLAPQPDDSEDVPALLAAALFDADTGKGLAPSSGIYFNDGADGDFRGRTENRFVGVGGGTGGGAGAHAVDLSAAKGRISLRIELPTDGDVYYFSQLGGADGVSFDADEKGRGLLHGALALLFAAVAALLLRRKY